MPHAETLPYRPALFRRGLALVLIPAIVGTAVTLFLSVLWHSAEKAAMEEQDQTIFVQHLNTIFNLWTGLSKCLLAGSLEPDSTYPERVSSDTSRLMNEFATLRKMSIVRNTNRHDSLVKLQKLLHKELTVFGSLSRTGANLDNSEMLARIKRMPKILSSTFTIRTEVRKLLNEEAQELVTYRQKESLARQNLQRMACGCAAGNVVLAILLVLLYGRSMHARMRVLTDNANKVPKGEILLQHLSGNDELTFLDKTISDASARLAELAEHRRSIFGMVAHDMRSPLMAAQASLQMVLEMEPDKSEMSHKELVSSEKCLSGILGYLEQLLTLEKKKTEASESRTGKAQSTTDESTAPDQSLQIATQGSAPALNGGKTKPFHIFLRPTLFHKLMLMVLAPLCVQICFLFLLNQQILKMEDLTERSRRYSDMSIQTKIAQMDLTRSSAAQGIYLITGIDKMRKLALKTYDEATRAFDQVMALCKADPEWHGITNQYKEATFRQIDDVLRLTRDDQPSKIAEVLNRTGEVKNEPPVLANVRKRSQLITTRNKVRLQEMEDEEQEANKVLSNMFFWVIAGNLVMAVCILAIFYRNLKVRLRILVDNARKLADREEMRDFVSGTDELAFLDETLHEAKKQLDHSARERTQIMASLADDMRRPLQEAQNHLNQVEQFESALLSARSRNQLLRSQSNISRVLALVDDLLTMESLEAGKVDLKQSTCDVLQIVEEALSTVSSLARRKGIKLVNSCQMTEINADRARICQVLINYLANAIKFSPANTIIKTTSEAKPDCIKLCVEDQGPGMDEETRSRVFEKFFQAAGEEKKQGFGLGLAICALIVQSHNGKLGVDSAPGKGSSFWFEIPRRLPEGEQLELQPSAAR